MSKKELKKLNRKELIQLLLIQARENETLKKELEAVKKDLQHREIVMTETGSIAEASLQLSGIFIAADEAVKQYVDSIQKMALRQEEECSQRLKDAKECAYAIISEANAYSKRKHEEADAYYDSKVKIYRSKYEEEGNE